MSELIKNGAVVADDWARVRYPATDEAVQKQAGKVVQFKVTGTEAAPPDRVAAVEIPAGKVIIPLQVFIARQDALAARIAAGEIGVWFESFELVEDLAAALPDLNALPVIAWDFPKFVDGRGFSAAVLLRTRYGYRNELRAVGDVLRDKLYYMQRCGFDAYQIRTDRSAEDALASLRDFSEPYQASVAEPQPLWRRHARA